MPKVEVEEFIVFMGGAYYPRVGGQDFLKYTSSIEDSVEFVEKNLENLELLQKIDSDAWVEIVRTVDMVAVKSGKYYDYKEEWEWQDGEFDNSKRPSSC